MSKTPDAFEAFGASLVREALSEDNLERILRANIEHPILVDETWFRIPGVDIPIKLATGEVKPVLERFDSTGQNNCELRYEAHLRLDFKLNLLGVDPYEGKAFLVLPVRVYTEALATIFIHIPAPKAKDIRIESKDWDLLLMILGSASLLPLGFLAGAAGSGLLKDQIANNIAERLKQILKENVAQRRVDLLKQIHTAGSDPKVPLAFTNDIGLEASLVGAEQSIGGLLAPKVRSKDKASSRVYFDILAQAGEQVFFNLYSTRVENDGPRQLMREGLSFAMRAYLPNDQDAVWEGRFINQAQYIGLTSMHYNLFKAPETARYRIELENLGTTRDKAAEVLVTQDRWLPEAQKPQRICFPEFGRNAFGEQGLTGSVIADAFAAALAQFPQQDLGMSVGRLRVDVRVNAQRAVTVARDEDSTDYLVMLSLLVDGYRKSDEPEPGDSDPERNHLTAMMQVQVPVRLTLHPATLGMTASFYKDPKITLARRDLRTPEGWPDLLAKEAQELLLAHMPPIVLKILKKKLQSEEIQSALHMDVRAKVREAIEQQVKSAQSPEKPPERPPLTKLPRRFEKVRVDANSEAFFSLNVEVPKDAVLGRGELDIKVTYKVAAKTLPNLNFGTARTSHYSVLIFVCDKRRAAVSGGGSELSYMEDTTQRERLFRLHYHEDGETYVMVRTGDVAYDVQLTVS